MFFYLVLLLVAVLSVRFQMRRRRMKQLASLIPGPNEELPVLGMIHYFFGNTEDIMKNLQRFSYDTIAKGGLLRFWFGHLLYFFITDPVDAEVILKTCLEKDDLHVFIKAITGNGGIFAPVSIWRRKRKILIPVFSPKILESFVGIISEQAENLAKALEKAAGNGEFSLWPFLSSFTFDSVCETTMGVKMGTLENNNSPFLARMNTLLHLVTERTFHFWLHPKWSFNLFPQSSVQKECLAVLHGFTDDVIQKKRDQLRNENCLELEVDTCFNLTDNRQKSFLDLMITYSGREEGYNNIELREEVLTLLIAGTETSTVTIANILKMLAKYPRVQERLYEEMKEVFGDSNRPLDKEDFEKLKYLERVLKETMRLFPAVPFVIRKVLTDLTLPSGKVLPARSGIAVSIWGAHRDPKYWGPDAEIFDPDRFLPERFNIKNSCSYMPFSNGPRNCIGLQYAAMSIKAAVTSVVRKYRVVGEEETSPAPKMRVKLDVTMKDVDGYQIVLEKRINEKPREQ